MSIVIFWLESQEQEGPRSLHRIFQDAELLASLEFFRETQKRPSVSHVVSCAEMAAMVGKRGVESVVNGKTPDGKDYDWSKSTRAGRFKEADSRKIHIRSDQQ